MNHIHETRFREVMLRVSFPSVSFPVATWASPPPRVGPQLREQPSLSIHTLKRMIGKVL